MTWSGRRRRAPLPAVPAPVPERRLASGRLAIVATIGAWAVYVVWTVEQQFVEGKADSARLVLEALVYLLVVTALSASATAYLITRLGYFSRSRAYRRAPRVALEELFATGAPGLTVLIPSYQEDERVIRTTVLTAALQEYPGLRVVVLVDDPPVPRSRHAAELLASARALPGRVMSELAAPAARMRATADDVERLLLSGRPAAADDVRALAARYDDAVAWLRGLAARHERVDHTDDFFAEHVVEALAADLEASGAELHACVRAGSVPASDRLRQLAARLTSVFEVEVSTFERKRYVSLSSEPNKAMNLNSYIGLMGGAYQEVATPLGLTLVPCGPAVADLVVPEPDYVLTLDADSMLLPEYAQRMVHLLEQGAHARTGVVQTPYSAYPGSSSRLERISGATTDVQHIVHQGMTHYDATFWVGANAVLRKRALDDIMEVDYEGDWQIRRYIQDRTVIEDTESTIDLGIQGWGLLNYPERLAYSATPPDFGSLCIQRQRWANGGLLILSKLRRQVAARRARGETNRFGELFLRVNYMASIFWSSVALLVMMAYPFNAALLNPVLVLVSVPYFVAMSTDLRACGYRRLDILRIYGFNLILLPVNLSGTWASMLQLVTGVKSAFRRTPKVRDRTTAPVWFLVAPWLVIALSVWTAWRDVELHRWVNLAFAATNATLATYAMLAFVGPWNTLVDLLTHLHAWLWRPVAAPRPAAAEPASVPAPAPALAAATPGAPVGEWTSVLAYRGPDGGAPKVVVQSHGDRHADGEQQPGHARAWTVPVPRSGSLGQFTFFTVFQPVVDLASGEPVGYEALTRFADGRSPQGNLTAAREQGLGIDLDVALLRAALAASRRLPEGRWLSVNVSPELLARPDDLRLALDGAPRPVVVDVADGTDPAVLAGLPREVMVAVDDAGSGYEGLSRLAEAAPAFVRVGRSTIARLPDDAARRAVVRTLLAFAGEHGATVIAEGIETAEELEALRELGVGLGQGFHLGRPAPPEESPAAPEQAGVGAHA